MVAPSPPAPEVRTFFRAATLPPPPAAGTAPPFAAWLLAQVSRKGAIGELAKAVKLDRHFPRAGSADDVRAHFGNVGADGDAYDVLDEAERAYDRDLG